MKTIPKSKVESAIEHLEAAKNDLYAAQQMIEQDQNANRYGEIVELAQTWLRISEIIEDKENQCGLKQLLK